MSSATVRLVQSSSLVTTKEVEAGQDTLKMKKTMDSAVGANILMPLDGKLCPGTIVACRMEENVKLWTVQLDNGQVEELDDEEEVCQCMELLNAQPAKNHDDEDKYTEAFWQELLDQHKAKVQPLLPKLDPSHQKFFQAACQHVQDCNSTLQDATAKRDKIQKTKPVDQDALDKAIKAVEEAQKALDQAQQDALQASAPLLHSMDLEDETFRLLLTTNALIEATPKGLADYCKGTTEDHKKALLQLFQDPRQYKLLQNMVLEGGAKQGKYGQALELYTRLQSLIVNDENKPLWQRMALAVALEFANPIVAFKSKDNTCIDPIQRFLQYCQAWRFGELDPVFGTEFGVWELRMALNSVAPDDQIGWGRQMLRNYRPDLMALQDKWRYCRIVRADVYYTGHPNWDPNKPLDFMQILSGGGECGPRAWMGRFICRAFGIPTWGVREPGHAAMARWTPGGWTICLGAPMHKAWWDDEHGLHFQVEAGTRKVLQPEGDLNQPSLPFGKKVLVLRWIANLNEEPSDQVVRRALSDPAATWRSLCLMQMRRLAPPPPEPPVSDRETPVVPPLEHLRLRNRAITEQITTLADGTIIIPATTCTTKPSAKLICMDSFLGGKQLFLNQDGHAEYTLVAPPGGKYHMTCHFVTVHDDHPKPPLLVTIDGGNDWDDEDGVLVGSKDPLCDVYSISLPCTWGMWQDTDPIVVEIPEGVRSCQISITREVAARGLALKDLKLAPVSD